MYTKKFSENTDYFVAAISLKNLTLMLTLCSSLLECMRNKMQHTFCSCRNETLVLSHLTENCRFCQVEMTLFNVYMFHFQKHRSNDSFPFEVKSSWLLFLVHSLEQCSMSMVLSRFHSRHLASPLSSRTEVSWIVHNIASTMWSN